MSQRRLRVLIQNLNKQKPTDANTILSPANELIIQQYNTRIVYMCISDVLM